MNGDSQRTPILLMTEDKGLIRNERMTGTLKNKIRIGMPIIPTQRFDYNGNLTVAHTHTHKKKKKKKRGAKLLDPFHVASATVTWIWERDYCATLLQL